MSTPHEDSTANDIDIWFDFNTDRQGCTDADKCSPTLCRYHRLLWSKPLPSGQLMMLSHEPEVFPYLVYRSQTELFRFTSDAFTTRMIGKASKVIAQIPPTEVPEHYGYTIGSSIIFPGNKIGRAMTINGARGCHPRIADRTDLTLECIKRHYAGSTSPLSATLNRYNEFFALFSTFTNYVEFFLLQDAVNPTTGSINFMHSFDDFRTSAVPQTVEDYLVYAERKNSFIRARAGRIADWATANLLP